MWDNLGKVKTKRTKPTKPYERPKSILRQVTDSVTGLLPQPSWLVNWLNPSTSKDGGESSGKEDEEPVASTSSAAGDRNVNSAQEAARESFIFQRLPGPSKDQGNGSAPLDLPPAQSNLEPAPHPPAREVSVQTVNGDDDSHSESTSGCSSLLPHPEHRNRDAQDVEPLNIDSSSLQMLRASLSKSFASEMKSNSRPSRKTLSLHPFSQDSSQTGAAGNVDSSFNDLEGPSGASFFSKDEISLNQSASKRSLLPQPTALNSKRPRFNATMFGPVVMGARRSFLNDTSIADSPFYAGRTTYGGASAYRRATIQPTLTPYPDARKRLQARPSSVCSAPPTPTGATAVSSSTSAATTTAPHVVLSSSAQKILHALEAMSTPVTDAKRIPTTSRRSSSASLQEEEPSFTGYGLSRRRPHLGPPTAKLSVARPAIVVSRAPTSSSTLTVGTSVLAASTPIAQSGGKMRSRVSATARESIRTVKENEEMPESDLPTVSLPVSSLPSFSLLPPPPTTSTTTVAPSSQPTSVFKPTVPAVSPVKPPAPSILSTPAFNGHGATIEKTEARPTFTFAAPLVTVSPSAAAAAAVAAKSSKALTFSFSSPLSVKPAIAEQKVEEKKPVEAKEDFPPSPFKPATELKTGSVMDILRKEAVPVAKEPILVVPTTPAREAPAPTSVGFGNMFKPPSDSWTCSVCCITNSKDKTICAACETPNPQASKPTPAPTPAPAAPAATSSFAGFGDKFKMSASQWECDTCMVRNLECDTQCKSCETPRPGSAKATAAAKPVSTFKFGLPVSTQEKAAESTSGAGAPAAPSTGFKFGAVSDTKDSKKEEPPTTGFKFGASLESAKKPEEAPKGGFKFGASIEGTTPAASVASKTEESTGGFKFGASLSAASSTETSGGFKFGATTAAFQPSTTPSVDVVKKTEAPAVSASAGGFQFGVGSTLQAAAETTKKTESALGKLLDTPATTASASSSFGGFGLATTVTTASKTVPILSFGAAPVQPSKPAEGVEGLKPAAELKTGSVLDILGKKPSESASAETASTAPSLSFGQPAKATPAGLFAFGKPAEPSSGMATSFTFNGPLTTAAGGSNTAEEQPTAKKPTFELPAATSAPAAASSTFTFGAASTPSLSMFKPATTSATTSAFAFGQPSATATTTSAPSFPVSAVSTTTTSAPAPSLFTFGSTAATAAATSTTAPAAPSAGIFTFGQSSAAPSSTFAFGAPAAPASAAPAAAPAVPPAAAPAAPSLFQFGKTEAAKSTTFAFGAPATTSAPASSATSTPFTFGAASASAAAAPATTQAEAPKSLFSFGSSATAQPAATTAAPSFGSFAAPTQASFAFGAAKTEPSITPFGTSTASAPASTPMFGSGFGSSATSTSAAAPFGFGAATAQPAAAPMFNQTASFNFGSTATPSAAPAASAPAAAPGLFTFGSSSPMPTMSQGFGASFTPAAFGAPSEVPTFGAGFGNPFDVSSSAATSGRKIRKAVRRR